MTAIPQTSGSTGRLAARAIGVAAFTFLCVLALGCLLVVGSKLQAPGLGTGASPLTVFKVIGIVSLGSLGAPVQVGEVGIRVLPLGGLALVATIALPAARRALTNEGTRGVPPRLSRAWAWIVGLAIGLGTLCGVGAELSAMQLEGADVGASVAWATTVGAAWGALLAGAGLWSSRSDSQAFRTRAFQTRASTGVAGRGFALAGRALTWFGLLCLAVAVTGGVARAGGQSRSAPAAVGTMVHGGAFAPNLAVAVGAVALGAPVEAGFSPLVSDVEPPSYSLTDWDGRPAPAGAWVLAAIPALVLVAAGARGRMVSTGKAGGGDDSQIDLPRSGPGDLGVLVVGAGTFSAACGVAALIAEARVGLDAGRQGFAHLAPDALGVFLLALGWSAIGLPAGWFARGMFERRKTNRNGTG